MLDALWFEPAILTTMDITTDGFGFMLAFGDLAWVPFTYSLQARVLVDHAQVRRTRGRRLPAPEWQPGRAADARCRPPAGHAGVLAHGRHGLGACGAQPCRDLHRGLRSTSASARAAGPVAPLQPLSTAAVAGIVALQCLGYLVFRGANSQKDLFRREPGHPRVATLRTLPTERGTRLIISGWWGIARHINYTGDWLMGWAAGVGSAGVGQLVHVCECVWWGWGEWVVCVCAGGGGAALLRGRRLVG